MIILPPVQVRRTTPTVTRWLRELTQRLLPRCWGWVCCWPAAGGDAAKAFHAAEHAGLGADPVCRSVLSGRAHDMGIGWNVLASCSAWRWASAGGAGGHSAGVLIGRSLFFARMFNPLIALLRPVSPLAWLPIGLLLFQKAEPASSWTILSAPSGRW